MHHAITTYIIAVGVVWIALPAGEASAGFIGDDLYGSQASWVGDRDDHDFGATCSQKQISIAIDPSARHETGLNELAQSDCRSAFAKRIELGSDKNQCAKSCVANVAR